MSCLALHFLIVWLLPKCTEFTCLETLSPSPSSFFLCLPPSQRTVLTEADTENKSEHSAGTVSQATRSLNRSLSYSVLMLHSLEMILLLAPFSLHSFFVISHFIQWHRANAFCGVCDKVVHFIWPQSLVGSLAHFSVHFGSCLFVFITASYFFFKLCLYWADRNSTRHLAFSAFNCSIVLYWLQAHLLLLLYWAQVCPFANGHNFSCLAMSNYRHKAGSNANNSKTVSVSILDTSTCGHVVEFSSFYPLPLLRSLKPCPRVVVSDVPSH